MEKIIILSNQNQDFSDKLFYNTFAYVILSSGINDLIDYTLFDTKKRLIIGIVYVFISILGFLRFNKLWLYKKPTYIKFTDEFIEIKLKPYTKPNQLKWSEISSTKINDLEFILHKTNNSVIFNLEWIPFKIANQVKFELLQRLEDKGIEPVG
jgi:hypothetical protein